MTAFGQPPGGGGFGPPPGSSPGGAFGPPPGGGGFGPPPGGGYGPPMGAPPQGASGMAIASLVLVFVSMTMCGPFTSIPGLIIAKMELGKIERGESAESGKILAQIGFWGNIAVSAFYLLFICLYVVIIVAAVGSASTSTYGGY